ncbi:MAG: FHA domain-containing protein [Planctomycetaceae bacterium]
MHTLIVESGKHKGKRIVLPEREVIIGRDENCFLRMTSAEVSRQHCALSSTDKGLLVRDLNSQNGTIVNNVRIEDETLLQPGDSLMIGPTLFLLSGGRPAKEPGSDTSEDDIAGWLSDSDVSNQVLSSSDTTVVKAMQQAPAPKADTRPRFKSVADEARDIIRRHFESQQPQQ